MLVESLVVSSVGVCREDARTRGAKEWKTAGTDEAEGEWADGWRPGGWGTMKWPMGHVSTYPGIDVPADATVHSAAMSRTSIPTSCMRRACILRGPIGCTLGHARTISLRSFATGLSASSGASQIEMGISRRGCGLSSWPVFARSAPSSINSRPCFYKNRASIADPGA